MTVGKFYKSVKTGHTAELIGQNEHGIIVLLDNGEERIFAQSTFKRWWKQLDETPTTPDVEVESAAAKQPESAPAPATPDKTPVAPAKPKVDTKTKSNAVDTKVYAQFVVSAEKLAEVAGSELFVREGTHQYNFRKDGRIYLYFTLTRNGVQIHAKTKAIGDGFGHIPANHNFDAKIIFKEWNSEAHNIFTEIHNLSLAYHKDKK